MPHFLINTIYQFLNLSWIEKKKRLFLRNGAFKAAPAAKQRFFEKGGVVSLPTNRINGYFSGHSTSR